MNMLQSIGCQVISKIKLCIDRKEIITEIMETRYYNALIKSHRIYNINNYNIY